MIVDPMINLLNSILNDYREPYQQIKRSNIRAYRQLLETITTSKELSMASLEKVLKSAYEFGIAAGTRATLESLVETLGGESPKKPTMGDTNVH